VITHHLLLVTDRRQVVNLVPLVQQRQVIQQLALRIRAQRNSQLCNAML